VGKPPVGKSRAGRSDTRSRRTRKEASAALSEGEGSPKTIGRRIRASHARPQKLFPVSAGN
jgi:hypothetical protein